MRERACDRRGARRKRTLAIDQGLCAASVRDPRGRKSSGTGGCLNASGVFFTAQGPALKAVPPMHRVA